VRPNDPESLRDRPLRSVGVTPPPPDPPVDLHDWRLGVWRRFLTAHARISRDLEAELARDAGLSLSWYDVLLQLAEAPQRRLRMADLADGVLLSRSGLTRLVDRLEKAGLVRREPSADDLRGTFTVLTAAGVHRLRAAVPVHVAGIRAHFLDRLDDDKLRALDDALAGLTGPAE
jgi:DNA-binding MarR family transcriptional regulator